MLLQESSLGPSWDPEHAASVVRKESGLGVRSLGSGLVSAPAATGCAHTWLLPLPGPLLGAGDIAGKKTGEGPAGEPLPEGVGGDRE